LSRFRSNDYRSENWSNGNIELIIEFQRVGLTRVGRYTSECPVVFDYEVDGVHFTKIDHAWPSFMYAFYLDGPPHKSSKVSRKDTLINEALQRRNWTVDRELYDPPLSMKMKKLIVDQIRTRLVEKGLSLFNPKA